jgi:hypothetical protein
MTIVIAMMNSQGKVTVGSDSCVSSEDLKIAMSNPKWVQCNELIIGYSGDVIAGSLSSARRSLECLVRGISKWPTGEDALSLVHKRVIPVLGRYLSASIDVELLICWPGSIIIAVVEKGEHVNFAPSGCGVIGSGQVIALGSLHTSISIGLEDPEDIIKLALESTCLHSTSCANPVFLTDTDVKTFDANAKKPKAARSSKRIQKKS